MYSRWKYILAYGIDMEVKKERIHEVFKNVS